MNSPVLFLGVKQYMRMNEQIQNTRVFSMKEGKMDMKTMINENYRIKIIIEVQHRR